MYIDMGVGCSAASAEVVADIFIKSTTGRAFLVHCKVHGWASKGSQRSESVLHFESLDKNPQ